MDNIELLKNTFLFTKFDEAMLADMASQVQEISIPAGTTFIKENEQADALYIIKEGAVDIFTLDNNNNEKNLAVLETGDYFGEQGLLENTPGLRNANIRTRGEAILLKIYHSSFKKIIEFDLTLKKALKKIGAQQLLSKLQAVSSEHDISKYLIENEASYETKDFSTGETIMKERDPPNGVFYLLSGSVNVYKKNELISTIQPNSLFGEAGLILGRPRQATLKAAEPVKTLFISPVKFRGFYQRQPKVKSVVDALLEVYKTPFQGKSNQYLGQFMDLPAVVTQYQLGDGREIISSKIVGKNILFIRENGITNPKIFSFENDDVYRELQFSDGYLTGVTSHGKWEEIEELYKRIFERKPVTEVELQSFNKTGMIANGMIKK